MQPHCGRCSLRTLLCNHLKYYLILIADSSIFTSLITAFVFMTGWNVYGDCKVRNIVIVAYESLLIFVPFFNSQIFSNNGYCRSLNIEIYASVFVAIFGAYAYKLITYFPTPSVKVESTLIHVLSCCCVILSVLIPPYWVLPIG